MSRKRKPAAAAGGFFGGLRLIDGSLVSARLSEWRRALDSQSEDLGYARIVYLIGTDLADTLEQTYSLEQIVRHDWSDPAAKCRIRHAEFDNAAWTLTGSLGTNGTVRAVELALTEVVEAEFFGGDALLGYAERMNAEHVAALGRSFYRVGPVYLGARGRLAHGLAKSVKAFVCEGLGDRLLTITLARPDGARSTGSRIKAVAQA